MAHNLMNPKCFVCSKTMTLKMQDDYIEGVYVNLENPETVLDRIADIHFGGKIRFCCRGMIMTHPYSAEDIEDVRLSLKEEEEKRERAEQGLPPLAAAAPLSTEPYVVPLGNLPLRIQHVDEKNKVVLPRVAEYKPAKKITKK